MAVNSHENKNVDVHSQDNRNVDVDSQENNEIVKNNTGCEYHDILS